MPVTKYLYYGFLTILIFCFFSIGFADSKYNSNFIVLKTPSDFRIYNKYEQNLSYSDSLLLTENCPLQFLNEDTLLSDNFTPCATVLFENQLYYLIKDKPNQSLKEFVASNAILIKNAKSLNDTIHFFSGNNITLYNPSDNKMNSVSTEIKLKRIFQKGNRTYIKTLSDSTMYGWIYLKKSGKWESIKNKSISKFTNAPDVESIIQNQIEESNDLMYQLFSHFNKINNAEKIAPYWHLKKDKENYICSLINNPRETEFRESTSLLINNLQLELANSRYKVKWHKDKIVVEK